MYGGAGVHVAVAGTCAARSSSTSGCRRFGAPRDEPGVSGYADPSGLDAANAALQALGVDLEMAAGCAGADLVHSHTWYANMAGHLAELLHGVPHVVTAHSLEPLRPWKAEQLGGGYALSSWSERTAYPGCRRGDRGLGGDARDVLAAYPDVDPARCTSCTTASTPAGYAPDRRRRTRPPARRRPRPPVRGVRRARSPGRRGCRYLLRAAAAAAPDVQLVLCAGAPDTPEIPAEVEGLVDGLRADRDGVVWIREMLPRPDVVVLQSTRRRSSARRSTSRSASSTSRRWPARRAVVATATGGIPEVVGTARPGCSCRSSRPPTAPARPLDPDRFVARLRRPPERPDRRSGPRGGHGEGGARTDGRALLLAADRPPHPRPLREPHGLGRFSGFAISSARIGAADADQLRSSAGSKSSWARRVTDGFRMIGSPYAQQWRPGGTRR